MYTIKTKIKILRAESVVVSQVNINLHPEVDTRWEYQLTWLESLELQLLDKGFIV